MLLVYSLAALLLLLVVVAHRTPEPPVDPRPWRCDRCMCAYGDAEQFGRHTGAQHTDAYLRAWDEWLAAYQAARRGSVYR